jgi:hypothetical protein
MYRVVSYSVRTCNGRTYSPEMGWREALIHQDKLHTPHVGGTISFIESHHRREGWGGVSNTSRG